MGSLETLAKYRYQRALEDLAAAKEMLSGGMYKPSLNRSYYSIFHAMRAITALEGFETAVCNYLTQIREKGTYEVMKSLL